MVARFVCGYLEDRRDSCRIRVKQGFYGVPTCSNHVVYVDPRSKLETFLKHERIFEG